MIIRVPALGLFRGKRVFTFLTAQNRQKTSKTRLFSDYGGPPAWFLQRNHCSELPNGDP